VERPQNTPIFSGATPGSYGSAAADALAAKASSDKVEWRYCVVSFMDPTPRQRLTGGRYFGQDAGEYRNASRSLRATPRSIARKFVRLRHCC